MAHLPTGTVTFLFTDIEGSTTLWERDPEAMRVALARHDALLTDGIEAHDGVAVKSRGEGDSVFAVFGRASDAVQAAARIQRWLQAEAWPTSEPLRVRMALHTGEAELREGDYYGAAVNRCARLRAAGHGGQILLSLATEELVRDAPPSGVSLVDLGERRLKDLVHPERVFQVADPDLPRDFPALRTLDARPHNLPVQPTPLIGREREVGAARGLLIDEDARLLTLTGPGGTGKTRLGLQVAADVLDAFEDGVFFVALAPISDPDLVASTIAQVLGIRDMGGRPILDSLKDSLRDKRLLLLLDNFEHILAAAPLVGDLLAACPRLKVVVTSRAALHLRGEKEFAVPPLALPDAQRLPPVAALSQYAAVALFVQRARDVKADFAVTGENAPTIAEICHRLDGLPLAIELASARIKLLPPAAMLARLSSRLKLLTGGARDLPARQQTLRDAIAWSYDLLDEAERALFRRLAVFVGGFTLEAAETVCAPDGNLGVDVLDRVASLVDKSLLRQDERDGELRFGMLETIREYGLERLDATGEAADTRRRHADYCLDLAEAADIGLRDPDWRRWLARLRAEHNNLRAALAWNGSQPDGRGAALRLTAALSWFWYVDCHLVEGRRWLAEALASGGDATSDRASALNGAALLAENQGDYRAAEALLEESLTLSRGLQDGASIAWSLAVLGLVARNLGEYERATTCLEESLARRRAHGDDWGTRIALVWLGSVARLRGDSERARTLLEEGLALCRQADDQVIASRALMHLGAMAALRGDRARAEVLLEESLTSSGEIGSTWGIAVSLWLLAEVACAGGDVERASVLGRESLARYRDLGDRRGMSQALHVLGRAAEIQGDHGRAAHLFGAEAALREVIGVRVPPDQRPQYDQDVAAVRAALGEGAFAAAWAEGRAMSLEQAVAYALDAPVPA